MWSSVDSGDMSGAGGHLDSLDVDQLLHGDSFKPPKTRLPDEECSSKQVFHRSVQDFSCYFTLKGTVVRAFRARCFHELIGPRFTS